MAYSYPAAAIGDKYLVTYDGTLVGQKINSTFWYQLITIVGAPDKLQVMDELVAKLSAVGQMQDHYRAVTPSNYTLNNVWCQPVDPIRYAKKVYPRGLAGTSMSSAQTGNIAVTLTRRSVRSARSSISSLHVPIAQTLTEMANGKISFGLNAIALTLLTDVVAPVTTTTGHVLAPIIRHGSGITQLDIIQDGAVQDTVRVMRRRTVNLGI